MSFIGDLVGAFTGSTARRDIEQGRARATADIDTGETRSRADYERGISTLSPYETGGREGYESYLASLGLRGEPARQAVQDRYFQDPIQNRLMDRIVRANTRRFTGVGMGNSGAATQSLTNALLANYRGYQDQLEGVGKTGLTAGGAVAQLQSGQGDTAFAAGQQRAGIDTSSANATAASRAVPLNNLLNIAGLGIRGYQAYRGIPSYGRA